MITANFTCGNTITGRHQFFSFQESIDLASSFAGGIFSNAEVMNVFQYSQPVISTSHG